MTDYKLNPPPPVEVAKEDLVKLILDLGMIYQQIREVQRALPYGPGNQVIKQRLSVALKSCDNLMAFFNSEYLP